MSSSAVNFIRRRRASIEVWDAKSAVDLATAQSYSENVFLFVPNLIGVFAPFSETNCSSLTVRIGLFCYRPSNRLHTRHPRRRGPALYELPSKVLHDCIWHIMLAGRGRWTCCPRAESDIKIRCCSGYGDGQVCIFLPFRLLHLLNV